MAITILPRFPHSFKAEVESSCSVCQFSLGSRFFEIDLKIREQVLKAVSSLDLFVLDRLWRLGFR